VWVLGHSPALVGVKEDIVDEEGSGNEGLVVGNGGRNRASNGVLTSRSSVRVGVAVQGGDGPEALVNRTEIKVDLDLVVLKGNKGEGKSRVCAEPELERNIKSGLWESVSGGTDLARSKGVTRRLDIRERRISDKGQLSSVSNHPEVSALLLGGHCELVPDVHPVTVMAVNSLASNLDLNLGNKLLTREIEPSGIDTSSLSSGVASETHKLVDLGECNLKVCAVGKISVSGDDALDTASKVGLSIESLFNRLNRKVSVSAVSNFPESNLRVTSKVNILSSIGN